MDDPYVAPNEHINYRQHYPFDNSPIYTTLDQNEQLMWAVAPVKHHFITGP